MAGAIRVRGLAELDRAFSGMSSSLGRDLRYELKLAGDVVRGDAAHRLADLGPGAFAVAAKYRVRVSRGARIAVWVDNPLRKVTGKRPDWGPTQMRVALEPALEAKRGEVEEIVEDVVDALVTRYFSR